MADISIFPENFLEDDLTTLNDDFEQQQSYAIDFDTMQYKKDSKGNVILLDKFESYLQWCQLAVMTDRNNYIAYDEKFGIDSLIGSPDRKLIESELERIISDALLIHPLTQNVDNFTFTWKNDIVYCEYRIISTLGSAYKNLEKEIR
ncbi:MAG: DUF2634 domain-containing protein [Clostridiales bacterium]|nr:DUF2634 domain-containing protein [Clostridiales bacterium]